MSLSFQNRFVALLAVSLVLLVGGPALAVQAQSTDSPPDVSPRFALGIGPALLSTVDAPENGSYQTYGVSARAEIHVLESLSVGLTGGLFRTTDHRVQRSFLRSTFNRRVITGALRAQLDLHETSAFRIYGIAGVAVHHADRSGETLRFNDAPPYSTDTQSISATTHQWGPQIGGGLALMRFQGAQIYAEPTFTALLQDTDNFGRVQLDSGVRLPL